MFEECLYGLFHIIIIIDLYINCLIKILKGGKNMGYQKSTVVEEKLAQKKEEQEKEIRKNNLKKYYG